jgi:uncharacterized protein YjbI with pentapeptide repeats
MKRDFYNETFDKKSWSNEEMRGARFECCEFLNSSFEGVNFMDTVFEECTFKNCNFTGAFFSDLALRQVEWIECKLTGISFEQVNQLGLNMSFNSCIMDYAVFYQMKIPQTSFINSSLIGTDFSEADLTSASFENADLKAAVFNQTTLKKCDFRGAKNLSIDLNANRVKGAIFNQEQAIELLSSFQLDIR